MLVRVLKMFMREMWLPRVVRLFLVTKLWVRRLRAWGTTSCPVRMRVGLGTCNFLLLLLLVVLAKV